MKRIFSGALAVVIFAMAGQGVGYGADSPPAGEGAATSLKLGEKAPEIEAATVAGAPVTLASFIGKPVVLQFGSISEPVFRMRVGDVEKMAAGYGDKVVFLTVYGRESHAADTEAAIEINAQTGFAVTKPVNQEERIKLASQAVERLKITNQRVAVDAWSNASSLRYGDYPNMTFVIDAKGNLQAGYPWMDPTSVKGAVDALLAGKAVPAEFRGKTHASSPGQPDLTAAAKDMSNGRGSGLSLVLDNLKLTDKQKTAVFPALAEYLADARDFREKSGGVPGAAGAKAGAKPATTGAAEKDKGESPEEFKKSLDKLRASAQKLKEVVKTNLSETDAKQVMEVLDRGPAHRLFAD